MNLHERWRPDPLSWSSRIRRSRQRRPDGDMRHRDVMVLLHRSCDGPDNACSKNLGTLLANSADLSPSPRSLVKRTFNRGRTGLPGRHLREQTANSEFANSVPRFLLLLALDIERRGPRHSRCGPTDALVAWWTRRS